MPVDIFLKDHEIVEGFTAPLSQHLYCHYKEINPG
jgi:hypothetical protein